MLSKLKNNKSHDYYVSKILIVLMVYKVFQKHIKMKKSDSHNHSMSQLL